VACYGKIDKLCYNGIGFVVYYGGIVALQFGGCFYCFSVALALVELGRYHVERRCSI
jgi:hypothetical protein